MSSYETIIPLCYRAEAGIEFMHFQQLRELYASACDIAESVNAIYSPVLLLSVARSFTSHTHILYYILISFTVQEISFSGKLIEN